MSEPRKTIRNIWMFSREFGSLAGAGGVKDVVAQLCRALARWSGRRVSVVLPMYGFIDPDNMGFSELQDPDRPGEQLRFEVEMNYAGVERHEQVSVYYLRREKVHIYLLDSNRFREKGDVYTYTASEADGDWRLRQGEGHFDYFAMNILQQKAGLLLIMHLRQRPDVIHCHDGHTAVIPAMIRENSYLRGYFRGCGCVVTIHNAGKGYHQEVADIPFAQAITGLPMSVILKSGLEDAFDPFMAAADYAIINTVSENYAHELQRSDADRITGWLGHTLLDRGVTIEGITNGIDPEDFNPQRGVSLGLAASFDPTDDTTYPGKKACRDDLLTQLSDLASVSGLKQYGKLKMGDGPLFTFIGRLSEQKGIDILIKAVIGLLQQDSTFSLVILGSGSEEYESRLAELSELEFAVGRVCFLSGYDPSLAIKIYAAGDFFLVPSRYEPCGLTDFIAQLFGNVPIVHHVGGLVKVIDGQTGLAYASNTEKDLINAMVKGLELFAAPQEMRRMRKRAVEVINSAYTWQVVQKRYLALYGKAMEEKGV